jgi:hypothetical protein
MWQNVKSVIAFFCILVYIAAAAFAVTRIYKAVGEQRFNAQQEFADLTDFAAGAGVLGFFSSNYIEDIKTQLDMSKALDAVIIYGPDNNKAAFEKKPGLISYKGDTPDFNRQAKFYRAPQSAPLRIAGNQNAGSQNISISAFSPLVNFNTLLAALRSSLLAILIAVFIAFSTLIIDISFVKTGNISFVKAGNPIPHGHYTPKTAAFNRNTTVDPGKNEDDLPERNSQPDNAAREEKVNLDEEAPAVREEKANLDEETPAAREEKANLDEETPAAREEKANLDEETPAVREEKANLDEEAPAAREEKANLDEEAPAAREEKANLDEEILPAGKGLLAAANAMYETDSFGGMDDRTPFIDELQYELRKAEAGGGDLTLLCIEWTAAGLQEEVLVKQAEAFFKNGSRVFEREAQSGVYVIVPGFGLDEIFADAKEFHRRARELMPQNVYIELFMGISARSERNVDAANLLNEAECALNKARSDSALPIVAFKADPQKYKEFMRRQKKL